MVTEPQLDLSLDLTLVYQAMPGGRPFPALRNMINMHEADHGVLISNAANYQSVLACCCEIQVILECSRQLSSYTMRGDLKHTLHSHMQCAAWQADVLSTPLIYNVDLQLCLALPCDLAKPVTISKVFRCRLPRQSTPHRGSTKR